MVTSETQEHFRSTCLEQGLFCLDGRLEFNRVGVGRLHTFLIRFCDLENTLFFPMGGSIAIAQVLHWLLSQ